MKLFSRLFRRKPTDAELETFARKMSPYAVNDLPVCCKPVQYMLCRWETVSRSTCSTAIESKGRCLSSLPCKYKGLCADAPITEQEV